MPLFRFDRLEILELLTLLDLTEFRNKHKTKIANPRRHTTVFNGQRDQFDDEQEIGECLIRAGVVLEWVSDVEWATELPVLADSKDEGPSLTPVVFP
ncbi:uncharacterized protein SAPINGB_P005390 [Magnusiomyces paraingens]|uniref:Uncharacterized protein n=1 Tax=Magnusiomyces paraingens TaxID=2606893 RepID=A0A5E8BZM7_9ASCO|nr:uncharacterized protein SAPINGB_P005390 [Saprochaete ingens]VVT56903.1 unnamed protein product [Saprochaete ingens]